MSATFHHLLYLVSVWTHLLAAVTWIGGMLFLVLVAMPVLRGGDGGTDPGRADLFRRLGVRFRNLGWICVALLVATGFLNLWFRGFGWSAVLDRDFWTGPYGGPLAVKLVLVALVVVLSAWHDFRVGPRARIAWQQAPNAAATVRLRRAATWLGRLNLLLVLAILFLAILFVRGW